MEYTAQKKEIMKMCPKQVVIPRKNEVTNHGTTNNRFRNRKRLLDERNISAI